MQLRWILGGLFVCTTLLQPIHPYLGMISGIFCLIGIASWEEIE